MNESSQVGRLTLTRKHGESLVIGENIRVTINRPRFGGASITIEAPRDVRIMRSELLAGQKETACPA